MVPLLSLLSIVYRFNYCIGFIWAILLRLLASFIFIINAFFFFFFYIINSNNSPSLLFSSSLCVVVLLYSRGILLLFPLSWEQRTGESHSLTCPPPHISKPTTSRPHYPNQYVRSCSICQALKQTFAKDTRANYKEYCREVHHHRQQQQKNEDIPTMAPSLVEALGIDDTKTPQNRPKGSAVEEDQKLKELIEKHGKKWKAVQKKWTS